jgi:threonine dehydratase
VLGPDDDITLFEYVRRSNRETGPTLVGIELQRRDDYGPLMERMSKSPLPHRASRANQPAVPLR